VNGDEEAAAFLRALGRRLRLLRLVRELSQEDLADAAGISGSFLSIIERGAHGVDVVRLWRLSAVLGVPLPELVNVGGPVADRMEGLTS
jgi:transcriptional regulator with XRE-family HTH domain